MLSSMKTFSRHKTGIVIHTKNRKNGQQSQNWNRHTYEKSKEWATIYIEAQEELIDEPITADIPNEAIHENSENSCENLVHDIVDIAEESDGENFETEETEHTERKFMRKSRSRHSRHCRGK
ncbi:hypothetical protein QE152_g3527 [Popillia japonica]|uniref:Uncharacterized protein n=1 Tax=Popillia japonica TaxID=7064 RepID=A0AAW1N3Y2_POPJA